MIKILRKNKNYKLIVGLFFGFIFSSSIVVYAAYEDYATNVSYDSSNNWLTATTVQGALDQLAEKRKCPSDKMCLSKKSTLDLGDYISYTPEKKSYTTDISKTGHTSTETIYPKELDLWRVLSINDDGTVDIISEYVSSTYVTFKGLVGYKNFIGYLNVLASQYETPGVTVGSRYFGYSNQTETITSNTYFVSPAPWKCSTGGTCTPSPRDFELYGGGDLLYLNDFNLAESVLETLVTNKSGTSTIGWYWVASRYYTYSSDTNYNWNGSYVSTYESRYTAILYKYSNNTLSSSAASFGLRPIVRLKSGLTYYGVGLKDYPMDIIQ